MKYCPYCGGELVNSAASFCTECGKSLSPVTPEVVPVAETHGEKKKKQETCKEKKIFGKTKDQLLLQKPVKYLIR